MRLRLDLMRWHIKHRGRAQPDVWCYDAVMSDDVTWITKHEGQLDRLCLRRFRLEVVKGPDAGLARDFGARVVRIGARSTADLQLSDPKVSGIHCELRVEQRGYMLRDLGSTNGTRVGACRIVAAYLEPGAVIGIGGTRLRLTLLDETNEISLWGADRFGELVGTSVVMRELFARIPVIAESDATVLVTGETGTGKELVAAAVHQASRRRDGPFVVLDCSSIPPNLIESEVFGHVRGAFTGAISSRAGVFERAHGGTLFLDEIGELSRDVQPKLLRVLETKQVQPLGGEKTLTTDVRMIAATNRNLVREVNQGQFRSDLYYRLAVARLEIPPLRERKEDIPLLVKHFIGKLSGPSRQLKQRTLEMMQKYSWPGNVRELKNMIERAVMLQDEPTTTEALRDNAPLPTPALSEADLLQADDPRALRFAIDLDEPLKEARQRLTEEFERRYLLEALEHHGQNVSAVARAAGVDRMTIHKMIERLGIERRGRS